MQEITLQRTGSGQLYCHIPKFIERHFGLREKQKVWVDIEGDRIVIYLRKPERSVVCSGSSPHGVIGEEKRGDSYASS
jgi:bifunctional DNA-binding transcriptional regulator/antitoxin component of YhaV-PrlF toxin-antitoxin module